MTTAGEPAIPAPGQLRLWSGAPSGVPVGVRIRDARRFRRWSQARLASAVGVDQSSISRFEAGTMVPTLEDLHRMADALDLALAEVVGRSAPLPQIHARGERRAPIESSWALARRVPPHLRAEFAHAGGSLRELREARAGLRHLSPGAVAILLSLGVASEPQRRGSDAAPQDR